ncbi:MAG: type I methionyl aminopeptidase [Candidatus Niyogibacteria bacterium]|nr:type I methionyl aminopeptidase [Candidatus Niyogibacteria bacterium]
MKIKTENELRILREGGKRLALILQKISEKVAPGILTVELDQYAEELVLASGGIPSFKGYRTGGARFPYPAVLCTSINDEIVHAIPGPRALQSGDIIGLDIGMCWEGLYTDTAITVPVGVIDSESQKLIAVTQKSLIKGIDALCAGCHLGDAGNAIHSYVKAHGLDVVRELVGHGVGRAVHEDPEVPNWGRSGFGELIEEGAVLALEPMVVLGDPKIKLGKDGWAWLTADGLRSAHFEHTVVVTKKGAEILTQ